MDAAKGINILVNNPGPINQYFGTPFYTPGVPLIMVVTTAGTGSESTSIGVVTDTQNMVKNSVICDASLGILDPEITRSLSAEVTTNTGVDTLAHAAEAITAKLTNPKSELLAIDAIKKVVNNLPLAVTNGSNLQARGNLLLASNFAGIAFNDSLVHLGHAIAHSVGAKFHLPHGVACALALPEVIKYAADVNIAKVKIVGEALGINFTGKESDGEIASQVSNNIREFIKKLGIKSLEELGITRKEFLNISDIIFGDPCYQFVPKQLSKDEMKKILENIYDNYK